MNALPKAYANLIGYSDVAPYEVLSISKSGKQITVRAMRAERDPSWKPEIVPGGFLGHYVNQSEQRWIISTDEDREPMKAHKRADGYFWSAFGKHRIEAQPRAFYDYNF
jgi:hypothetical protein